MLRICLGKKATRLASPIWLGVLILTLCCVHRAKQPLPSPTPPVVIQPLDTTATQATDTAPAEEPLPQVAPPAPDYDSTEWAELTRLEPGILLDLRYATTNNFVEAKMYDCPRCFLRPEVAKAVVQAHLSLKQKGLGLKMYDCYRPLPIQWKLWNKVPDPSYVADPRKGSMHNRGMAVDLTIVDAQGNELDMGTGFDYFGQEAYHSFTAHPKKVLDNRSLLKTTMEAQGFRPTPTEWWHYSYKPITFPISEWLWKCQ